MSSRALATNTTSSLLTVLSFLTTCTFDLYCSMPCVIVPLKLYDYDDDDDDDDDDDVRVGHHNFNKC